MGIRLDSGEHLELRSLQQRLTYGDVIEGVPNAQINRRHILSLGQNRHGSTTPRVVLPVVERVQERPGREPASFLPRVECTAHFYGPHPEIGCVTELIVVFFQEEWAMPSSPLVASQIAGLNWAKLSRPFYWD